MFNREKTWHAFEHRHEIDLTTLGPTGSRKGLDVHEKSEPAGLLNSQKEVHCYRRIRRQRRVQRDRAGRKCGVETAADWLRRRRFQRKPDDVDQPAELAAIDFRRA